ncbi:hypothetical protein AAF712_006438 [Marasmius tenuissimus]|uniref:Uncharacterized protein n=1 Tax=Marasmius tenuissimus TaxID=585030 RepID=A0ABR2ZZR4_9AGAR
MQHHSAAKVQQGLNGDEPPPWFTVAMKELEDKIKRRIAGVEAAGEVRLDKIAGEMDGRLAGIDEWIKALNNETEIIAFRTNTLYRIEDVDAILALRAETSQEILRGYIEGYYSATGWDENMSVDRKVARLFWTVGIGRDAVNKYLGTQVD